MFFDKFFDCDPGKVLHGIEAVILGPKKGVNKKCQFRNEKQRWCPLCSIFEYFNRTHNSNTQKDLKFGS